MTGARSRPLAQAGSDGVQSLIRLGERVSRLVAVCRQAWMVCQLWDGQGDTTAKLCDLVRESREKGDID
jgi:hypothetical protein